MILKIYIAFISFCFVLNSYSQNITFENTELCKKAYSNIIALRLDSGLYYLNQEEKSHPNNNYTLYLHNYIDFLNIFTSGDMDFYENSVKKNFSKRIDLIKKSKTEHSPYYLYIQAEIYLHSAILSVQNKDYLTSIYHLRKALKKLEENEIKFPDFKPNKKSLGLLNSILGSVPDALKTGFSIIGLNGDINKGMKMLETLTNDTSFVNQHETATIYAFMLFHLNNEKEKAWKTLEDNHFFDSNNLMDIFAIGHIGVYGFHNDKAIEILKSRTKNIDFIEFPLLDYILGIGKTYRLDEDANEYFKRFLKKYKGLDYIKSSYQKMAWNELIRENDFEYEYFLNEMRNKGRTVIDADKQATKELDFLVSPDIILLRARLLTDGNYLQKAITLLNDYSIDDFMMPKDKIEYLYRLGRIHHKKQDYEKALSHYQQTIEIDNKVAAYFPANACYLIGYIYEQQSNNEKALKYYEKCSKMNGYEYDNSIKQKAKAGVNRLKVSLF